MKRNTENLGGRRWSKVSMVLHGVSATFIFGLGAAGFVMSDLPADSSTRFLLSRMHTLGGITLMLLTVGRLVYRARTIGPKPLNVEPLHRLGIRIIHTLMYLALFALGASGLATGQVDSWQSYLGGERGTAPDLTALASREAHEVIVLVLFSLIVLHVGGVAVHEVRRGGALGRMFPFVGLGKRSPKEGKE